MIGAGSYGTCMVCGGVDKDHGRAPNGRYVGVCDCAYKAARAMRGKSLLQAQQQQRSGDSILGREVTHIWVDEAKSFSSPDAPAVPSSEPASFDSGGGGDFSGGGSSGDFS